MSRHEHVCRRRIGVLVRSRAQHATRGRVGINTLSGLTYVSVEGRGDQ